MLTVEGLEVWRGDRCLLSNLSFELRAQRIAMVVGPNGSGKSSLLRVLAGLSPPGAGCVHFDGEPMHRLEPERRLQISYRGHLDGLKKELSISENLKFQQAMTGGSQAGEVAVLDELELTQIADRRVRFLSAGQRRRAGLAALKLHPARVWILDEPLTSLDSAGRELISSWIREHVAAGGLAVVATHHPEQLSGSGSLLIEL